MNRATTFAIVTTASLLAMFALFGWYLLSYQPSGSSLGGMMNQMMGAGGTSGALRGMPSWVWGATVGLVVLTALGLVGLGYYLAYPEIRPARKPEPAAPGPTGTPTMNWSVLMRTSKPEEKKVLEVLAAHDGSYLQKFVVKEAGLSKLKTHRIVSRLAERGVVDVERSGNTNQVSLAPWVKSEAAKPTPGP